MAKLKSTLNNLDLPVNIQQAVVHGIKEAMQEVMGNGNGIKVSIKTSIRHEENKVVLQFGLSRSK